MPDPDVQAQVVAEWKSGSSERTLAQMHRVSRRTIARWVAGHERAVKTNTLAAYDLDAMALRLISGSVSTLGAIHGIGQQEDWLRKQSADELAIFYGVIADKLIRVLAAIPKPDEHDEA